MIRCALVPLIPNEDTPARRGRPAVAGHGSASVSSPTAPASQSTCGDGASTCNVARQLPVPHRQHHLDHPGHPRRRLRMPDVRLHRPQPQRPPRPGPARTSPSAPAPRSGPPARVPVPCPSTTSTSPAPGPRVASAARITRCCDGPFGAVSPLDAPSWFTALPAHHRQHPVTVTPRIATAAPAPPAPRPRTSPSRPPPPRYALHRPSGASPPLPGELHEHSRRGHHRHPARQRQRALPAAQRLRRQVQRHQRGRARRVHRHRRALQTQAVRHPARHHAGADPGQPGTPRVSRGQPARE